MPERTDFANFVVSIDSQNMIKNLTGARGETADIDWRTGADSEQLYTGFPVTQACSNPGFSCVCYHFRGVLSEQRLESVEDVLRRSDSVLAAYLYGSFARGEQREGSDIDIGLLVKEESEIGLDDLSDISRELEKLTDREVDLRVLNGSETRFVYNTLREAELLFSVDEEARRGFEYRAMRRYLDMKPFYREYDSYVRERITP